MYCQRIARLTEATPANSLHLVLQPDPKSIVGVPAEPGGPSPAALRRDAAPESRPSDDFKLRRLEHNHVYPGDCVSFLQRVKELHPDGVFDLAFADPPYNLAERLQQLG